MTKKKISSSNSPKKSLKNSVGKKVTPSTGTSKMTTKSSSLKSKTQQQLKKNTSKLTTTSPKTTRSTKKKSSNNQIKLQNSRKLDLFPYIQTFPIYLEDKTDNKRCWFTCIDHAQKYVDRYKPIYKCYQYTGKLPYNSES